jgi:hypothetical protein
MRPRGTQLPESRIPPLHRRALFIAKAAGLRMRRRFTNAIEPPVRHARRDALIDAPVIAISRSELRGAHDAAERPLIAGKIENLRIAIERIDGIELDAGDLFSFWRQLGRASRSAGYVAGRELREGCLVPSIGGGLCQLSNALYDAALTAGLEIVERHPHTRVIAGSLAERDRDATIFWNYLDLRFRAPFPLRIEARLERDELVVTMRAIASTPRQMVAPALRTLDPDDARSCMTCGEEECSLHRAGRRVARSATTPGTAWLLDDYWPELERYLLDESASDDIVMVPIDARLRRGGYRLDQASLRRIVSMPLFALRRSLVLRRVAMQGAARQRALLALGEQLAQRYRRAIPYDAEHIVVMQSMLPALARSGALGGRTYDVFMTALPISHLQERLDAAARLHPESPTLGDFRAPQRLVDDETAALAGARRIITPHSEVASLFGERTVLLDWMQRTVSSPTPRAREGTMRLLFPCSTLGRKGAYELREAARGLDLEIAIAGRELEGDGFWNGARVVHRAASDDLFAGIDALVLPSFVEHRPRRALEAIARDIPVIVTDACGIAPRDGVTVIPWGDADALRRAIVALM